MRLWEGALLPCSAHSSFPEALCRAPTAASQVLRRALQQLCQVPCKALTSAFPSPVQSAHSSFPTPAGLGQVSSQYLEVVEGASMLTAYPDAEFAAIHHLSKGMAKVSLVPSGQRSSPPWVVVGQLGGW